MRWDTLVSNVWNDLFLTFPSEKKNIFPLETFPKVFRSWVESLYASLCAALLDVMSTSTQYSCAEAPISPHVPGGCPALWARRYAKLPLKISPHFSVSIPYMPVHNQEMP